MLKVDLNVVTSDALTRVSRLLQQYPLVRETMEVYAMDDVLQPLPWTVLASLKPSATDDQLLRNMLAFYTFPGHDGLLAPMMTDETRALIAPIVDSKTLEKYDASAVGALSVENQEHVLSMMISGYLCGFDGVFTPDAIENVKAHARMYADMNRASVLHLLDATAIGVLKAATVQLNVTVDSVEELVTRLDAARGLAEKKNTTPPRSATPKP